MKKAIGTICILITQLSISYAHIGSPGVLMEGKAGPYTLLVNVSPPDVIPGVAYVTVYFQNDLVNSVSLRAVDFNSGDEGAPKGESMKRVEGQAGQYSGELWLMGTGSTSVQLMVNGKKGIGEMVVPVVAVSTAMRTMPPSTGILLAGLGTFLFLLLITIIGSSVSDALTREGDVMPERRRKTRWVGMLIASVLASLIVFGGNKWWQNKAKKYTEYMFKPTQAISEVRKINDQTELVFTLDTNSQRNSIFSYIVPDHGKMMHMFITRIPFMDAFAHLHPIRIDSTRFKTILPSLPKGDYLIFGDIVYNTGFTETIKDTVAINSDLTDSLRKLDNDDAYAFALPADAARGGESSDEANKIYCGKPGTGVRLKDGSTMVWESKPNETFESGQLYTLKFAVITPDGKPAKLEPYLGMPGHAAIIRNDGNVYIHLHPVGTYSMAAEKSLVKRINDSRGVYQNPDPKEFRDSIDNYIKKLWKLDNSARQKLLMAHMNMHPLYADSMGMKHNNMVEFPYSFPAPGQYRIWVQVKRGGQILTGAFDKTIK